MTNEFKTDYQTFIYKSRYARWRDDLGRRETWSETVKRYIDYFYSRLDTQEINLKECEQAILNLEVMPSMRCLMTAGKALDRDNVAGYNCSYVAVDDVKVFDEIMYILMCGTGVGFSVERQYINKLPEIVEVFHPTDSTIVVKDSKIGWATSYRELLAFLYSGKIPKWDLSKIRAAGERLKTFGGRASGPQPLDDLFRFTVEVFKKAAGRKLNSLECHDLVCKIADAIVVGGVRRSALISLSNLTDERMKTAKAGQWWEENSQRALANNSVCYTEKPDMGIFLNEWKNLYDSKCGERGIFNRQASILQVKRNGRRDPEYDFGCNPCSEIILRNKQFCNLTEVIVRPEDTLDTLKYKVKIATVLGTIQSTLTDFRYLSKQWKNNTEEERLLGVSLTGIMDNYIMSGTKDKDELKKWLQILKDEAIKTNQKWAKKLGIQSSAAITCVKPSGTVSQLVDSSSGIHPRYSPYYIRTVRNDKKDPISTFLIDNKVPYEDAFGNEGAYVFSFPIKSPKEAVCRNNVSAVDQLELWKIYQEYWCEHKPSITVFYKESNFMEVGNWVYSNFDIISGVSFLPHSNHIYKQAPYQELNKEEYATIVKSFPEKIDWEKLPSYEKEDTTDTTKELACSAGNCELI